MGKFSKAVEEILTKRKALPLNRAALVAVTGIDGSGKGFVTGQIVKSLREHYAKAIGINIDGWLNLPHIRFNFENPAEHFYRHAIRFEEMFEQLILPLKANRRVHLVADYAEETANEYRKQNYDFEDIDIIVLEGIFLLKREFRKYYDLSFWLDCSFETALKRAIKRSQEGLPPEETIRAYETIYFPAQWIHFELDNPQTTADFTLNNDTRITVNSEDYLDNPMRRSKS